jgi:hypothetical protein
MGPWVLCRATLQQALSTLFGQFLEEAFSEVELSGRGSIYLAGPTA